MQNLAPIALFVYNRPQHTQRTIKFLQQNELATDSRLYIFSDGPRTAADDLKVAEVREFIKNVDGFKSVTIIESRSNKGLANSVIEGVSQLTENYGQVIVFEDDLISSPFTLTYFNEALNRYREEEKVMHIGAYMYPLTESSLPESFFYRAATSWGWATWHRAWKQFNPDIDQLMQQFTTEKKAAFSIGHTMNFWKQMLEFKNGKNNSWAIRWYASIFLKGGLTLNPAQSLVNNIGHDGTGVHSGINDIYNVVINPKPITCFPDEIKEHQAAYTAIRAFLQHRKGSLINRIERFLKEKWKRLRFLALWFFLLMVGTAFAQKAPAPYGAVPQQHQLEWHKTELYGLIHFTPTTYENKEWGYGDADPKIFNPQQFDADQIIKAAKAGGLKGIVLVAKHHDGFALWPTKTTPYNISQSPFRNGNGDLVKEIEQVARKNGLKFGVYCSPWDRNHPTYGTSAYLSVYQAQLKELYSNYGELFMSWHDGANGGDGFYGGAKEKRSIDNTTYYDWKNTWGITRTQQPGASIFSDVGPDVRWVGNEYGFAADTSWATFTPMPPEGKNVAVPGQSNYPDSPKGIRGGQFWMPAECDVPLRKGWFFHPQEKPKTPDQLFDLYLKSVGRGAALDLGLAPDTRGLMHEDDVAALKLFGDRLRNTFAINLAKKASLSVTNTRGTGFSPNFMTDGNRDTYWASADGIEQATVLLQFKVPLTFDIISLQEYIPLGQRIDRYVIEILQNGQWKQVAAGASIGAKRLVKLPQALQTAAVRIHLKAPVCLTLAEVGLYKYTE